ncbi:hypothetical protein [Actinomadura hibisca]|uniref:hypothetical protein n=1 Tax=Actinomadura hibisca TaxID=68565 RepID=UPI0012F866AA|nr:hypothetical protein [Actinomadura hibisca]
MAVVAALTFTASCSGEPSGGGEAERTPTGDPAVTVEESARALKDWMSRHNKALTSGDEKRWRDTVTGALAAPVEARVKTYGGLPESARISLLNPVLYVPRQNGYPRWFGAAALERTEEGKEQQILAVFVRTAEKEPWRAAHWLTFKGRPPEVAYDAEGYAVPADDRALPAAHAAYLTSGDQTALTPDAYSTKARERKQGDWRAEQGRFSAGPGASYALKTKDGGSLVWYGLRQEQTLKGGSMGTLPGDLRSYLERADIDPGEKLRADWQWLAIGYSPVNGRASILGESVSLTDAD